MTAVHHLVLGDGRHGVSRLARSLIPAGAPRSVLERPLDIGDFAADDLPSPDAAPRVHVHLTDSQLGPDPVARFVRLCAGRRVAVTLHDVPQPAEGEPRYARRRAIYRRLAEHADAVLVSSRHERTSLRACGYTGPVEVVDHPIDAAVATGAPDLTDTVGVLGWLYPGKGHNRVLHAMHAAVPGGTLVAIGAPAPGHEALAVDLARLAASLGLTFHVTGYLPDDELLALAARVAVPVCAHRHISASGTLGTWMGAGRVPIAPDHPYAREVRDRCPGSLRVADALDVAIGEALLDPSSTILASDTQIGPTTPQAARAQARILDTWAAA